MSPRQPVIVSFNLERCDGFELSLLRDIFHRRAARCMHLATVVPAESAAGIEEEAEGHAADARRVELQIARRDADRAKRQAAMLARIQARHRPAQSIGTPDTTS